MRDGLVTLFLGGDVMTGRGVDQILPHPGDPRLWEGHVRDARTYVALAERVNGAIARPVDFSWPWGDALELLAEAAPDARVINLETSITRSDEAAPGKGVHYRMTPENVPCLLAAAPDVCALANNHVLDFGHRGLAETCAALATAKIAAAGAGGNLAEARRPALVPVAGGGRVVVFSFGTWSSGIPPTWAATPERAGVDSVPDPSDAIADEVADRVQQTRTPGDVVVASIHWGSNWGYEVPAEHIAFAHRLIDNGIDIIHGHSSHHPRPIEIYRGKLILYGCGDLIDDYEGIRGYEQYRDDLRLLYLATVQPQAGHLVELHMMVMQARQMRLHRASTVDVEHMCSVLRRVSQRFGSRVELTPDATLHLYVEPTTP